MEIIIRVVELSVAAVNGTAEEMTNNFIARFRRRLEQPMRAQQLKEANCERVFHFYEGLLGL